MSEEEMNKIIKGKTHFYENDTLTTGTFPNDITITYSPSRVYDTEEIENIIKENNKLKQQLQVYKDKHSDLETDYAKAVENEKTLSYTCNKYYDELQAYKDKEDKIRDYLSNTEFEERTAYDKSFCEGVYNTKEKALKILDEGE